MRVIIGAVSGTTGCPNPPHQLPQPAVLTILNWLPQPTLRLTPQTAQNDTRDRTEFSFNQTQTPPLPSQINISEEEPQVGSEAGSFLCFFVNVWNLLDGTSWWPKVLGLESRGQTGCSWVRRPPRQRLTRLIEQHIV